LKEVHQITVCDELQVWWTSLFSPSSTKAGLVGLYSKHLHFKPIGACGRPDEPAVDP
jgi:hypothetical protein